MPLSWMSERWQIGEIEQDSIVSRSIRQWCNKGQVMGARKVRGKGRTGEWRIAHDELVRLQNEGPLPLKTCQGA